LNNLQFKDYLHQIYPSELEIKKTTDTPALASYLDLYLYIDNFGRLKSKLYKRFLKKINGRTDGRQTESDGKSLA
jgi:hypothetical protein